MSTHGRATTTAACISSATSTTSTAYVTYDFSIPSAVKYGKLTLSVLGAANARAIVDGPATLSIKNWSTGEEKAIHNTGLSYRWYSTSATGSAYVSSHHVVRTWVTAYGSEYGNWDVAKVKLTYRYALLR